MSEVAKPVEETVAAPAPAVAAEEPVVETKAVEPAAETPAVAEPATEEAAPAAEAVAEPVKPVEEGILSYKGPGNLIKTLLPGKKFFFWFGSDAIEEKKLASFIRGEKDSDATVAWATHTGKGLLLFSKTAAEKATPAGVINLSEITEITPDGTEKIHFLIATHKYTLGAASTAERDNWLAVLKAKSAEATELKPSVVEHEAYKSKLESLKKPVVAAAAAATPKKSTEVKKEEKAEAKEEMKEEKAEAKEEKKEEAKKEVKEEKKETKKRTSRSASRKRGSVFGTFGFGKKEEAAVEPKTETPVAATEPAAEVAATEAAPVEAVAPAPAVEEPVVPAATEEVTPAVEEAPVKPAPTKRSSIFGTIGSKFSTPKKEAKTEVAPAFPAKDAEPVSETAPVIPAVEATEPLAATTETPAAVPTETLTNGETKAAETPAVTAPKDKRKSSLPWLSKKDKPTSESESEEPKSPFSKIRNTFKKPATKKSPTTETPAVTEPAATEAAAVEETPAATEAKTEEEPKPVEPVSAAPATAPIVAATA